MNTLALDLLASLRAAAPYGLDPATLLRDLRALRHRALTLPELELAIRQLADASLVAYVASPVSGPRWRITALGSSTLAEAGL